MQMLVLVVLLIESGLSGGIEVHGREPRRRKSMRQRISIHT